MLHLLDSRVGRGLVLGELVREVLLLEVTRFDGVRVLLLRLFQELLVVGLVEVVEVPFMTDVQELVADVPEPLVQLVNREGVQCRCRGWLRRCHVALLGVRLFRGWWLRGRARHGEALGLVLDHAGLGRLLELSLASALVEEGAMFGFSFVTSRLLLELADLGLKFQRLDLGLEVGVWIGGRGVGDSLHIRVIHVGHLSDRVGHGGCYHAVGEIGLLTLRW